MPAPQEIIHLVERFRRNLKDYQSGRYNETQVRLEFIDPFFEALGWDIHNKKGYAEAYKDVVHEDQVRVSGATKAPDYGFRIGGTRKFFVEAKKPSINIKDDVHPAYQLRRYAWSAKLPLSILTDFEELAVYDCRVRPVKTDKTGTARVMYFTFDEYPGKWDEIAGIFSREAVLQGSFDRYAESSKPKRGTAEVDAAFLQEIERWREVLARNIALRNPGLTVRDLNFAVQRTIDRIIFLRIAEDRGLEPYGRLRNLAGQKEAYAELCQLYRRADERYNSGLFHFKAEKGRAGEPDEFTIGLRIDDKVIHGILRNLYYPDSPYEFSVLPADILGQVYEQFLGKVIRLTPGGQAKVEDKPEVKKAGGVYYTPTYIVDYIVKHTVGMLLEGLTPNQASELKICDPACGSGSFLLGAYQYLLDWHRDAYVAEGAEKYARPARGRVQALYQAQGGDWRLTTAEKRRILLNNIYGVDIDPQAVEVTKLSLLLKVLEGENEGSLGQQLAFFQERALPDLEENIKCGNSLIGTDFYNRQGQQIAMFDAEELQRVNAFDWQAEFPGITAAGGFDAVIGNPPYVRQELLGSLKEYFRQKYNVYHGIADLYAYFIEKGLGLLAEGGMFGYIVSNKWIRANYGSPLRAWLKDLNIIEIIDFGDLPVFKGATTYPCILIIKAGSSADRTFEMTQVGTLTFYDLNEYVELNHYKVIQEHLNDEGWILVDKDSTNLLEKIRKTGISISDYVNERIYRGLITGLNEAFVIDGITRNRLISEDAKSIELIKPFLIGQDIKRYEPLNNDRYIILIPRGWTKNKIKETKNPWLWFKQNYPAIASHLEPFAEKAEKRYDKGDFWWELRACDYYQEFERTKIIYPNICKRPEFTFDNDSWYTNQKCFIIPTNDKYLLGLLNSSVTFFLFRSVLPKLRGGFYEPSYVYFREFPVRNIDFNNSTDVICHDRMVALVESMLALRKSLAAAHTPSEKQALQRRIDATDRQIDALVYELYGLTEEEIKIVETGG